MRRSSAGLWLAETIATFGLVLVVFGVARSGGGELLRALTFGRQVALLHGNLGE
jgi:hypothetical protein